jgi:hypothetical protein
MLWASILAFLAKPAIRDTGTRIAVVAIIAAVVHYLVELWPLFVHVVTVYVVTAFYYLVIFGGIFFMFMMMIAPMLLGKDGAKRTSHWFGHALWMSVGRTIKFLGMTCINTSLLVVRIFFALFSKTDVAHKITDAGAHYIERQADLVFKPMR